MSDPVDIIERVFGGVELSVRVASPPPPGTPLAMLRGKARAKVTGCTSCELHATCSAPVAFSGSSPADYIVIGEAPGPEEDKAHKPFIGPSGRLLRSQLDLAGLSPSRGFFMNAASCFPNDNGKITQPTNEHLARCRDNMFAQMQAAWCQVVLLCGATAIRAWRFDMKVERVNGNVYVWDDQFIVIPCIHPAAVVRKAPGAKMKLEHAIKTLAAVVNREQPALSFMDDGCIACDTYLSHIDADGVGYCTEHWTKGQHDRAATRERWASYAGTTRLL